MIRLPRPTALSRRARHPALRALLLTGLTLGTAFGLAGCAAPPLRLYTLGMPSDENAIQPKLSSRAATVAVSTVVIPDYLDSQDMVVRRGEEIVRSPRSRWATRLSIGITDLIANEMAGFHPSMLITDQPLADAATLRVQVDISRFDVDMNGQGTLDAHWAILPADTHKPIIRNRAHLTMTGPVSTDADVAALMRKLVITLADKVNADLPVVNAGPN